MPRQLACGAGQFTTTSFKRLQNVSHQFIASDSQLAGFIEDLAEANSIAFDTEFVSERTYRPQLCLVQVATDSGIEAIIDPLAIEDLTPFWDYLAEGNHDVIVHAGRSEAEFCYGSIGRLPERWFDVQIGSGLAGLEFPSSYAGLVSKLLKIKAKKSETRTDWARRPLSERQIDYAMDDARYLVAMRGEIEKRLEENERLDWWEDEQRLWSTKILHDFSHHRWRKVSGSTGLDRRALAILRELWRWREKRAEQLDKPAKWILRDDLMVELCRRKSADPKRIMAIRGMDRRDMDRLIPKMAEHITAALELPGDECPKKIKRGASAQWTVLGQFLFSALGSLCRRKNLAPALVGSPSDVRAWLDYRHDPNSEKRDELPVLTQGWRAEVVGQLFDHLLSGKASVRITDPWSDHPLEIIEP
jgi:ribonuclease D